MKTEKVAGGVDLLWSILTKNRLPLLTFLLYGFSGASQEDSAGQSVFHRLGMEVLVCYSSIPSWVWWEAEKSWEEGERGSWRGS